MTTIGTTDNGILSVPAASVLRVGDRVYLDTNGKAALAGLTEKGIGTIYKNPALAADDFVAIHLWTAPGPHLVRSSGDAHAINEAVFTAAAGEVGDTEATAYKIGTALEAVAATADLLFAIAVDLNETAAV